MLKKSFNTFGFKKVIVYATLLVVTSSVSLMAAGLEGEYLVNGQWVSATLYGESISVSNGQATAEPPWALIGPDGKVLGHGDGEGTYPFRRPAGKTTFLSETEIILSEANGIEINSIEQLDVSIYDASGRCVYTTSSQSNVSVDRHLLPNGHYMLRLTNKGGETITTNFMLINGKSFISKSIK
jgi:hypothetical protein